MEGKAEISFPLEKGIMIISLFYQNSVVLIFSGCIKFYTFSGNIFFLLFSFTSLTETLRSSGVYLGRFKVTFLIAGTEHMTKSK